MYLEMPFLLLFGKKIWVIRTLNVFITLAGSISLALILRNIYNVKNYWLAVLAASAIPIFFIHSRAEFATGIAISFFAISFYFYFLYRTKKPKYLLIFVLFLALAFYSYFGIWLTIAATILFLLIFDFRYHLKKSRIVGLALLIAFFLFLPFLKYQQNNFQESVTTLSEYNPDLIKYGLSWKNILQIRNNYLLSFNPKFLFLGDPSYHVRHYLKGYGYFPIFFLPLTIIGLIKLISNLKDPSYRILLIILIISPFGGILVGPGATRILPMTIPIVLLTGIGIKFLENIFPNKIFLTPMLFSSIVFFNLFLTYDTLKNSPTWFSDYGLYGMQFGAKQLYQDAIPQFLKSYPNTRLFVSPNWANKSDVFLDFFLTAEEKNKIELNNIDFFVDYDNPIPENLILVMTPEELNKAKSSNKIKVIKFLKTIAYPDKNTGFYFTKIAYEKSSP